jgi:anti-sigma factor RsiW
MRGRLKEQDLTDYALNELPPDERIYVESMLGLSEECRNDVYEMLELSEMLKDGMQRTDEADSLVLSDEQRCKVLAVPAWNWRATLQKAAAILLLASGTAFTATRPGVWQRGGVAVDSLASASHAVQGMVADAQEMGFARSVEEFRSRLENVANHTAENEWQFASEPAVCTPPVWTMDEPLPEVADM